VTGCGRSFFIRTQIFLRGIHNSKVKGAVALEIQVMDGGEIFYGRDLDGDLLGFQRIDDCCVCPLGTFSITAFRRK